MADDPAGFIGLLSIFGTSFSILVIIIVAFSLPWQKRHFQETIYDYEYKKEILIESRKNGLNIESIGLTSDLLDINKKIAKHKAWHESWILKGYFSEEIANLEPLK